MPTRDTRPSIPRPSALSFALIHVHVVPHTHWDREWYHAHGRFRQRLVALIDELIDDPPVEGESFLLDGQAIIVEDYLAVRPERRDRLVALLASGRLEAGPWYVLADELIPSGEALVRNLLVGRRVLRSLGTTTQPILYCPDAFGHPAALPELANGFGLPVIIAWRGFGSQRWPRGDTFAWRAPSGASAILFHLPSDGYEFGSSLPDDDAAARERWTRIHAALAPRSITGVVLLQNGADHHARQRNYPEAVAAIQRAAGDAARVRGSSMRAFTDELLEGVKRASLSTITGELRDSYGYTWTLQGTFATRAHQKRLNAIAERMLVRDAEPFSAIARARGADSRLPLTVAAWKTLLHAHPHDTLCGCSLDDVARAMDVRIADATTQSRGITEDALLDIVGHDREVARVQRKQWKPAVVIRNRAARPRGGVAFIELREFIADIPVGPGSPTVREPSAEALASVSFPEPAKARWFQVIGGISAVHDRVESPRHYPDDDLTARTRAAIWIEPLPGYGTTMLPLEHRPAGAAALRSGVVEIGEGAVRAPVPATSRSLGAGGITIENAHVRLVARDGTLSLEDLATGRRVDDIVLVEDLLDRGDLYTPSIHGNGMRLQLDDAAVVARGPLVATWRLRWRLIDASRSRPRVGATLDAEFTVVADSPVLRVRIRGANARPNHRSRIGLRTGLVDATVWADAAFGPVQRAPLVVRPEEAAIETPPPTAPLHRYVSLFSDDHGATLFSDGLAEYEATSDGTVFVTLVRAVGELSRNDLRERPGHAGWPTPTPLAQSPGPFAASLGLMFHGPRSDATIDQIERAADDVLLPLTGETLRSALHVAPPAMGAELSGRGLAFSALKESEDGDAVVVRCVNLFDREVEGAWRFGFPIRGAHRARLDETMIEPLPHDHDRVSFRAGPREVVTIVVNL